MQRVKIWVYWNGNGMYWNGNGTLRNSKRLFSWVLICKERNETEDNPNYQESLARSHNYEFVCEINVLTQCVVAPSAAGRTPPH